MDAAVVVEVYCEQKVVFTVGKRKFRSLFVKVRAEVRRQLLKKQQTKHNRSFQYDPLSYALNFDDGHCGFFFC